MTTNKITKDSAFRVGYRSGKHDVQFSKVDFDVSLKRCISDESQESNWPTAYCAYPSIYKEGYMLGWYSGDDLDEVPSSKRNALISLRKKYKNKLAHKYSWI